MNIPITDQVKLRILCKALVKSKDPKVEERIPCTGVLEGTASEIAAIKPLILCPVCKQEFSMGTRFSFNGDKVRVAAQLLGNLHSSPSFGVELIVPDPSPVSIPQIREIQEVVEDVRCSE